MMKLTANYVPDLSAYIIGLVQSIEATNVIIFVMAGHEETREPTGKFSLDDDDDSTIGNDSIDQQLLYIQRSEILQAKYVKVWKGIACNFPWYQRYPCTTIGIYVLLNCNISYNIDTKRVLFIWIDYNKLLT